MNPWLKHRGHVHGTFICGQLQSSSVLAASVVRHVLLAPFLNGV